MIWQHKDQNLNQSRSQDRMIDQVDLSDLASNQLIVYYNYLNEQKFEGYDLQKNMHTINRIKNKLINSSLCGELLRNYEGRL